MYKLHSLCGGLEPDLWGLLFLTRRSCSLDTYKTCPKNSAHLLFWVAEQLIPQDIPWPWTTWPISAVDADKSSDLQTKAVTCRHVQAADTYFKQNEIQKVPCPPQMTMEKWLFPPFHEDADDFELIEMVYVGGSTQSFLCHMIHHISWLVNIEM